MSRAPIAGQTKTRLIPALGAAGAAAFHVACLNDLLADIAIWRRETERRGLSIRLTLSLTPSGSEAAFRAAGVDLPGDADVAEQRGGTLDERMRAALRDGLTDAERVVLVGADLPLLTWEHLERAVQALLTHDAVLGPAMDGGYYLIGVWAGTTKDWEGLFESGPGIVTHPARGTVLQCMLARARALGLNVAQLESLPDVDTPEDARRVLAHPLARQLAGRRSVTLLRERFGG